MTFAVVAWSGQSPSSRFIASFVALVTTTVVASAQVPPASLRDWIGKVPEQVVARKPEPGVPQETPHPAFWADAGTARALTEVLGAERFRQLRTGWGAGYTVDQPFTVVGNKTQLWFFVCKPHECSGSNVQMFFRLSDGLTQACWTDGRREWWLVAGKPARMLPEGTCSQHDPDSLLARQGSGAPVSGQRGPSLAFSRQTRVEIFGASNRWCDSSLSSAQLDVLVPDRETLASLQVGITLQKVGHEVVQRQCPAATTMNFRGFVGGSPVAALEGRAQSPEWVPTVVSVSAQQGVPEWGKPNAAGLSAGPPPQSPGPPASIVAATPYLPVAAAPVRQRSAYPGALATLDVGGVRLGMKPSEVRNALREANPAYTVSEVVVRSMSPQFGPQQEPEPGSPWPGALSSMIATADDDTGHDQITVTLMPEPELGLDRERVVDVLRWRTYITNSPTVANLQQGAQAKTGRDPSIVTQQSPPRSAWIFNPAGMVVGTAAAATMNAFPVREYFPWTKPAAPVMPTGSTPQAFSASLADQISRGIEQRYRGAVRAPGMPVMPDIPGQSAMRSDGPISLQMAIGIRTDNPLLAQGFVLQLIDERGAYNAMRAVREMIQAEHDRFVKEQREKAAQQAPSAGKL